MNGGFSFSCPKGLVKNHCFCLISFTPKLFIHLLLPFHKIEIRERKEFLDALSASVSQAVSSIQ